MFHDNSGQYSRRSAFIAGAEWMKNKKDLANSEFIAAKIHTIDSLHGINNQLGDIIHELKRENADLKTQSLTSNGDAVETIEFAEWLHLNKYKLSQSPKGIMWHTTKYSEKTTEELFELFKNNKDANT